VNLRLLENNKTGSFRIGCRETREVIAIARIGALKVARVCQIDIETLTPEELALAIFDIKQGN